MSAAPKKFTALPDRHGALKAWWEGRLGRALVSAESELLAEALEDVFGWELLQVGAWGAARALLAGSRSRRARLVAPFQDSGADVLGRPSQLPIVSDSVDAVLLPHTLEFASDPYAIVREVDRVLVGEGQLLVLGFRPWSLWGLRALSSRDGYPPGMRRVLSERRVREWLWLLGYEVVASRRYLYCSPWSTVPSAAEGGGRLLRRSLLGPLPAAAYLIKARKRLYTLTPVRPRLREKPAVIGGLVKPTTRLKPTARECP
jgi:SAM-dependent methyltransferase